MVAKPGTAGIDVGCCASVTPSTSSRFEAGSVETSKTRLPASVRRTAIAHAIDVLPTPSAQRHPTRTLITPGTENGSRPDAIIFRRRVSPASTPIPACFLRCSGCRNSLSKKCPVSFDRQEVWHSSGFEALSGVNSEQGSRKKRFVQSERLSLSPSLISCQSWCQTNAGAGNPGGIRNSASEAGSRNSLTRTPHCPLLSVFNRNSLR